MSGVVFWCVGVSGVVFWVDGGVVVAFLAENTPKRQRVFIDNLLVRIHLIVEMILAERPCAMGVLISLFQVTSAECN